MTRFAILLLGTLACSLLLTGCSFTPYRTEIRPPVGLIASNYKVPLTGLIESSQESPARADEHYVRIGTTFSIHVPFIVLRNLSAHWGNREALDILMQDTPLTSVSYADYQSISLLNIFHVASVYASIPKDSNHWAAKAEWSNKVLGKPPVEDVDGDRKLGYGILERSSAIQSLIAAFENRITRAETRATEFTSAITGEETIQSETADEISEQVAEQEEESTNDP